MHVFNVVDEVLLCIKRYCHEAALDAKNKGKLTRNIEQCRFDNAETCKGWLNIS